VSPKNAIFLAGGGIRVDYLITRDGRAHSDKVGGNAIYAAVGAAIWSDNVSVWGRIGENYPRKWIANLADSGINGDGIKRIQGDHDHRTFYAYQADGSRDDTQPEKHYFRIGLSMPESLVGYRDSTPSQDDPDVFEPLALRKEDWSDNFQGVTAVHLAPLPLRTHMELAPFLRDLGIEQITVDPGERYMRPNLAKYLQRFLPNVDVFLPSEQEMRSLFGPKASMLDSAKTLGDWGAKCTVIKCGSRGVSLFQQDWDHLVHLAPYHEKRDRRIIDVTGAGDSFCGGFMVGLSMQNGMEYAAKLGLVSASFTIEGYGAPHPLQTSQHEKWLRLKALENQPTSG